MEVILFFIPITMLSFLNKDTLKLFDQGSKSIKWSHTENELHGRFYDTPLCFLEFI